MLWQEGTFWKVPEGRLLIAVLWDALVLASRYVRGKREAGGREAYRWMLSEDESMSEYGYSFRGLCLVLKLDPDAVRHSIGFPERYDESHAGKRRRSR